MGRQKVLKMWEVATPTLQENQVLVKVHAASVNYGNLVLLTGKPFLARLAFGLRKPKYSIPGGDMAGVVEAIGPGVTQFQVGDEVYGDLSSSGWGAFAEYVAVEEEALALKPSNLTYPEAASVPMAATTALQAIRDKGKVTNGQEVLIVGASGGVGTFAIQIAKAYGAKVTAVVSTRNVAIAKSLGADHVIDYKKGDISKHFGTYDVILKVNGSHSIATYRKKLKENGKCIFIGGSDKQMHQMLLGPLLSIGSRKKFIPFMQQPKQKDLVELKELIENGRVKPVLDKIYSFHEIAEAFRYFQKGHSQGKVVIIISQKES